MEYRGSSCVGHHLFITDEESHCNEGGVAHIAKGV